MVLTVYKNGDLRTVKYLARNQVISIEYSIFYGYTDIATYVRKQVGEQRFQNLDMWNIPQDNLSTIRMLDPTKDQIATNLVIYAVFQSNPNIWTNSAYEGLQSQLYVINYLVKNFTLDYNTIIHNTLKRGVKYPLSLLREIVKRYPESLSPLINLGNIQILRDLIRLGYEPDRILLLFAQNEVAWDENKFKLLIRYFPENKPQVKEPEVKLERISVAAILILSN